jgi:hypothetical protein
MIEFTQHPAAGTPRVGEYWPGQGGIYAGIMPDYEGHSPYHLVLSADEGELLAWGGYLQDDEVAGSDSNGQANTDALTRCGHAHPAARWAADYQKDGHSDFHLPAKRELDMLGQSVPDQFSRTAWYWSSTQRTDTSAWGHNFNGMPLAHLYKAFAGRARAVRRIFVSPSV